MAFFGLTALGPQDTFERHSKNFLNLHIFEDNDFESAWLSVATKEDKLSKLDLEKVLLKLFHGPVPKNDHSVIMSEILVEVVHYGDYFRIMRQLTADTKLRRRENLKKCSIESARLQDKILSPLTSSQEYGWEPQDLKKPVAGREASDETKYAAELVKAGIFY